MDTVVVGAGLAGLALARKLSRAGRDVVVIERSRGVGGRCATRRVEGQPVDHGVVFAHATDPELSQILQEVPGTPLPGWPDRVLGEGTPCNPWAFHQQGTRMAWAEGLTALPKHLAVGLQVRTHTTVSHVSLDPLTLHLSDGSTLQARDTVLALAAEQTLGLLPQAPELLGVLTAMGWFRSVPCLTLIATYPLDLPAPDWQLYLPTHQGALQLVSHDSDKRQSPRHHTLVLQASPRWSREHLELSSQEWAPILLDQAAQQLGGWVREPSHLSPHRWRFARVLAGSGLGGPWLHTCQAQRLGLCGEIFDPAGGLEGAWRSGIRLAQRLLTE